MISLLAGFFKAAAALADNRSFFQQIAGRTFLSRQRTPLSIGCQKWRREGALSVSNGVFVHCSFSAFYSSLSYSILKFVAAAEELC